MRQFICLLLFTITALSTHAQERISLGPREYARKDAPVYITLSKAHAVDRSWELQNVKTGKVFPAQLLNNVTLVFIPREQIAAGATPTFILRPAQRTGKPGVRIEKKENGLLITANNKPLFFYHTAEAMPPAGSPAYYKRSGFIHPLYTPAGAVVTDDFPAGHMHQHGIFMTWVNTTFRNQKVDFWNQHAQTGTVQHVEVMEIKEGPVFSRIRTKLHHISLAHGPVLEEIWNITIYPFADHFLFDLQSDQVNITKDTLYLNKYHYGGLAVRGSKEWNRHDSVHFRNEWKILTSEGKDNASANHTAARWVDASGKLNDKTGGVTVFGHPSNFRFPQTIRLHPDMPYWCFAPMVESAFTIDPGKNYRSAFRFFVHDGGVDTSIIEKVAMAFKDAPF